MNNCKVESYKEAKTIKQQLEYLTTKKRIQYNVIDKELAGDLLKRYNYINVITPFKHRFAKLDSKKQVIKEKGEHVYLKDVEFYDYYQLFVEERSKYPVIVRNVLDFELHFKSIVAYHVLTRETIMNSQQLELFLDKLSLSLVNLPKKYKQKRIDHMIKHINDLKKKISDYADVYCYFDRMSLGNMLTIFICLNNQMQNIIFGDLKKFNMNLNVQQVNHFIDKVFTLVSIRNCVMHCNSLEILVRFYNPKTHELRRNSDKKNYQKLIKHLSKEKTPTD